MVETAVSEFGRIDYGVNCAGVCGIQFPNSSKPQNSFKLLAAAKSHSYSRGLENYLGADMYIDRRPHPRLHLGVLRPRVSAIPRRQRIRHVSMHPGPIPSDEDTVSPPR